MHQDSINGGVRDRINHDFDKKEKDWNQIAEYIKALGNIYESKINCLEKSTHSIRNQQYREINVKKKEGEKQHQQESGQFSWDPLWAKIDTAGKYKNLDKEEKITKKVTNTFVDIEDCKMSYHLMTCMPASSKCDTYPSDAHALKVETMKNRVQIKTEMVDSQKSTEVCSTCSRPLTAPPVNKRSQGKNCFRVLLCSCIIPAKPQNLMSSAESNALKGTIGKAILNIGRKIKNCRSLSNDLDRFLKERIPSYAEGIDPSLLVFDEDVAMMDDSSAQLYRSKNVKAIKAEEELTLRINQRKRKTKLNIKQEPARRTLKKKVNTMVKEFDIFTQPKSTNPEKAAKANQKIDSKILELSHIAQSRTLWNHSNRNIPIGLNCRPGRNPCELLIQKRDSKFNSLASLRSAQISEDNIRTLIKTEPYLSHIHAENPEDFNFGLSESSSEFEHEERNNPELKVIKSENKPTNTVSINLNNLSKYADNEVIDLDSESNISAAAEEVMDVEEDKPNPKRMKLKSEGIFYANQYEANSEFIPHNNLIGDNNFDYTIEGLKEKVKVQKHRTIDLRKIKKIITTKITSRYNSSVKRIKVERARDSLPRQSCNPGLDGQCKNSKNVQNPCDCDDERQVHPNLFTNVYKEMKDKNPSLSVHSYFIACLHSTKEHDMDLVNLNNSETELNFVFNRDT